MNTNVSSAVEMPKYRCHKEVWAFKIRDIQPLQVEVTDTREQVPNGAMIFPAEAGFAPIRVYQAYVSKHNPQVGGYYVVYKDGYESFSPAEAFEDGYTLIR